MPSPDQTDSSMASAAPAFAPFVAAPSAPAAPAPAGYPDNNPKSIMGAKKPNVFLLPPAGLLHAAKAMMDGARKYGAYNWRQPGKMVSASVYLAAGMRHKWAYQDGEDRAIDSLVHHLGHDIACDLIILDAIACGALIDDRPPAGGFSKLLQELTIVDDQEAFARAMSAA